MIREARARNEPGIQSILLISTTSKRRAAGTTLVPNEVKSVCVSGINPHYHRADAEPPVAAGLINDDQVPGAGLRGNVAGEGFAVRRHKDGSVNAIFTARHIPARVITFKRSMGCLLADTDLSLVRNQKLEP